MDVVYLGFNRVLGIESTCKLADLFVPSGFSFTSVNDSVDRGSVQAVDVAFLVWLITPGDHRENTKWRAQRPNTAWLGVGDTGLRSDARQSTIVRRIVCDPSSYTTTSTQFSDLILRTYCAEAVCAPDSNSDSGMDFKAPLSALIRQ